MTLGWLPLSANGFASPPSRDVELLVNDLDDLLRGREALEHIVAERPLLDLRNEVFDDAVVDVRFE